MPWLTSKPSPNANSAPILPRHSRTSSSSSFCCCAAFSPLWSAASSNATRPHWTIRFLTGTLGFTFLVPAVGMRLWAEERRVGTIELLLTMPITTWQAIVGKFLASWLFLGLALILTFPIWITVNYLGSPDNGIILCGYIGSWLVAGGFLAIVACLSALS